MRGESDTADGILHEQRRVVGVGGWEGGCLPDRARPLVMRGHPEEQPVLSRSQEGEACESEEGQSFGEREREKKKNCEEAGKRKKKLVLKKRERLFGGTQSVMMSSGLSLF